MALHDSKWAPVAVSEPGGTGVCTYSRVQCGALVATPPGSTAQVAPVDLGLRLGPVPGEQGHEPACMWCDCRRV